MKISFFTSILFQIFALISLNNNILAATVSPADLIKIESLSVKCSEPGQECPRLAIDEIIDIVYLVVGDEYILNDNIPQVVTEEGLLVTYKKALTIQDDSLADNESVEVLNGESAEVSNKDSVEVRFFPMSKVQLSPDSDFYMCGKGQEFSLDHASDLSSIGLTEEKVNSIFSTDYQPMTFTCKCFWAPKTLFDELGIKKYDKKTPDINLVDLIMPDSPMLKVIENATSTNPDQPWNRPITPLISIPPYNPYNPNYPTYPTHPVKPVPMSPVGSECGLFQFVCAFNLIFGS